jgi:S-adenosylmethionine hydrolase
MTAPVITLTTDFGDASPYVAVMKGVILSINPSSRVLDLTHHIRPQNVRHAEYFLATALPHFPPGTIHLCVVDPGVGSDRRALVADAGGQRLVAPDNGVLTGTLAKFAPATVWHLTERQYWREPLSDTFHGRDIFAPVAAHLSCGVEPMELGPAIADWVELPSRSAVRFGNRWRGEVRFIDDFGNLITNIPADRIDVLPQRVGLGGGVPRPTRWVRTYAEAAPGEVVALFSSDGFFEIALVNGNAARDLGALVETEVVIEGN